MLFYVTLMLLLAPLLLLLARRHRRHETRPCTWPQQSSVALSEEERSPAPPPVPTAVQRDGSRVFQSLWTLFEYVMRDFIHWWYDTGVAGSGDFPDDVRELAEHMLLSLSDKIMRVEWGPVLRQYGLRSLRDMIKVYHQCELELSSSDKAFSSKSLDERNQLVLGELQRTHRLHEGLRNPQKHMRSIAALLLRNLLPEKARQCPPLYSLLREILTCNVLVPLLESAKPSRVNSAIVQWLSSQNFDIERSPSPVLTSSQSPLARARIDAIVSLRRSRSVSEYPAGSWENLVPPQQTHPWKVQIVKAVVKFDPRPFVMYVLEVEYSGTHWTVARRYSDFVSLHHKLKEAVPHFRGSLPKKTFFNNLKRWFIEQRRMDLHRYLVQVQFNRSCIDSDVWTRFLVPDGGLPLPSSSASVSSLSGIHPVSPSMSSYTQMSCQTRSVPFAGDNYEQNAEKKGLRESRVIAKELYELVEAVFGLDDAGMRAWIASRIIQVSFDGFITRMVHEQLQTISQENVIVLIVESICSSVWPGGEFAAQVEVPTADEEAKYRNDARCLLENAVPTALSRFLGKKFCKKGVRKLFAFLQVDSLVKHFVLILLDAIVHRTFPPSEAGRPTQPRSSSQVNVEARSNEA